MDIGDFLVDVRHAPQMAIISAASLPEAVGSATRRLPVFQAPQERRALVLEPAQGALGYNLLQGRQNHRDTNPGMSEQDHVDVFWHGHIGPEVVHRSAAPSFEGLHHPRARSRAREQRQAVEAGKG
jgi:hypothetical protein